MSSDGIQKRQNRQSISALRKLPVCSPSDALRREVRDLRLDSEEHLLVCPSEIEAHQYLARVALRSYGDLEAIGLVPRGLKEAPVRRAISLDDEDALRISAIDFKNSTAFGEHACSCIDGNRVVSDSLSELSRRFQSLRRSYNPELAKLVSEHKGIDLKWDSIFVSSVYSWVTSICRERIALVGLFRNITIGNKSKLELSPAARALLAHNINIHREGQLIHRGSYLRIWSFGLYSYLDTPTALDINVPIWALNH